jgi:hypothetical protein
MATLAILFAGGPAPTVGAAPISSPAPTVGAAPIGSPAPTVGAAPISSAAPHPAADTGAAPAAATTPGVTAPPGVADIPPGEDIRDIRGPKKVFPAWLVPALLAAGVLLAIGGYAAWRWRQRRRLPRALLPFEVALQRLEALRPLMQPATVREFSIAISDIVRGHIEQAFAVTATHRTTEEFLRDLLDSSNASLAAHRNLLAEFLNRCDVAKFAGVSLSRQIMESLLQSARSFVIETSKPPAAIPPPPAHDSLPAT